MKKYKIVTVVGARPQFVKAAALSRELLNYPELEEVIVHTGQHFDGKMSDVFFDEMDIPKPRYNLAINSLGHGAMTGRMLEGIEEILLKEKPDLLLVYGDTNSTIAGALAAKKLHIKVGHVEAGLRSFNIKMPEEVNRILTDRISDVLFCPTDTAVTNLHAEGYDKLGIDIIKSGDVMQDAAMFYAQSSEEKSTVLSKEDLKGKDFCLVTVHRAENTDDPERLSSIFSALNEINSEVSVVLPIHPRTKKILESNDIQTDIKLIEPVGYFDMIELLKNAKFVMTDSGGSQKEAFFFKKHCITLRDETEWVELVKGGFNSVVGASKPDILDAYNSLSMKKSDFSVNLYGNGEASQQIAKGILKHLS
jgi:UDP-GlcNAc3NAcA epimerase